MMHAQAEVIRRELAEDPGVLQSLNIDTSSLELMLDTCMPPHCLLCASTSSVQVCATCNATAWCTAHKGVTLPDWTEQRCVPALPASICLGSNWPLPSVSAVKRQKRHSIEWSSTLVSMAVMVLDIHETLSFTVA